MKRLETRTWLFHNTKNRDVVSSGETFRLAQSGPFNRRVGPLYFAKRFRCDKTTDCPPVCVSVCQGFSPCRGP